MFFAHAYEKNSPHFKPNTASSKLFCPWLTPRSPREGRTTPVSSQPHDCPPFSGCPPGLSRGIRRTGAQLGDLC